MNCSKVSARGEQLQDAVAVHRRRRGGLHPLLNPSPSDGVADMHVLDADRAAVVAAAILGGLGIAVFKPGRRGRRQAVHRVEVRQQVAKPAVGVQALLVQGRRALGRNGRGSDRFHGTPRITHLAGRAGQMPGKLLSSQVGDTGLAAVLGVEVQHLADVGARLGVGRHAVVAIHRRRAGVIGGQGPLQVAAGVLQQAAQVAAADVDVDVGGRTGRGRRRLRRSPR